MKALLTSAGFDNDNLVGIFYELLEKPPESAKALFIPTALNSPEARKYIHVFKEDLYKVGIRESNINSYNLDEPFGYESIIEYDVVLVCPGDPDYLMKKIIEMDFIKDLEAFQNNGGVYIGISAGSDIAAANHSNGLGYIDYIIECHAVDGTECGPLVLPSGGVVRLTDNQAVVIKNGDISIVE
jgi:dipeptidase E